MRIAVRLFVEGQLILTERIDAATPEDLDKLLPRYAERHIAIVIAHGHAKHYMLEFEFLDGPVEERFLRFGTDPRYMVLPRQVDLPALLRKPEGQN